MKYWIGMHIWREIFNHGLFLHATIVSYHMLFDHGCREYNHQCGYLPFDIFSALSSKMNFKNDQTKE